MTKSLLFVFVLLSTLVRAQNFKGKVIDDANSEPVAFASVFFHELESGTITDENGLFNIDHYPKKIINIQISSLGYETISEQLDLAVTSEREFRLKPSHIDLEEVVVSVPGGRLQSENVISIDRMSIERLSLTNPRTLSDALRAIPGVEQFSTGAGISKPVIRGLSGNRIVTYSQGIRIENQQWGSEHGLGVGSVGIGSVEVIKGPASLLYGADALGGVLYFVDEAYARHDAIEANFSTGFHSNNFQSLNRGSFKIHKGNFKFNLHGQYVSSADYGVPSGKRAFNTRYDENNVKSSFGFNLNNWISNIRYSYLQNGFGINDTALLTSTTSRRFRLPFQKIDNHNVSFENTLFTGSSKINLILGYTDNFRREFEGDKDKASLAMNLRTSTYNLKWYSANLKNGFQLIVGSQGMLQSNKNSGEELLIPNATTTDVGIFSVLNYEKERFRAQAGLRGDHRQIGTQSFEVAHAHSAEEADHEAYIIPGITRDYSSLNYSAGASYSVGSSIFKTNISSGYRAPNTSEIVSFGVHEGTNRFEIGDPDLKSENAIQLDISYANKTDHLEVMINPFVNHIQNYIYLNPVDSMIDNTQVFAYNQIDATLFGGEAGIHYHPHTLHWLHIESTLSSVFAEDKLGNPLPLIPATRVVTVLKAEFTKPTKIQIKRVFVKHEYKFKQNRVALLETRTSDYNLLSAGLTLEFQTKAFPIEFNAGVNNALNTKYIDHLSRLKLLGIPNPGINIYAGLQFSLDKNIHKDL